MIDDSPAGTEAAQAAGMRAIGFDEGGALGRVDWLGGEVVHHAEALFPMLDLD